MKYCGVYVYGRFWLCCATVFEISVVRITVFIIMDEN